jgi:hypothetical protein
LRGCGIVEDRRPPRATVGVGGDDKGTSNNKYKDEIQGFFPFDSAQGQKDKLSLPLVFVILP